MKNIELKEHDNIDRDVIIVNKDTLELRLQKPIIHASTAAGIAGSFTTAISLLLAALLTEGFTDVLFIPGESLRIAFMIIGILALVRTGYLAVKWSQSKDESSLESVIDSFLPQKSPIALLPEPKRISFVQRKKREKKVVK